MSLDLVYGESLLGIIVFDGRVRCSTMVTIDVRLAQIRGP